MQSLNSRAGKTVRQSSGYIAYVPSLLPPDPPIAYDSETIRLLSDADQALGNLAGISSFLPNPDLFAAMYVKKEAVLSSQIENIQCTLEDVLQHEADKDGAVGTKDVGEVVNYVNAMNFGIERMKTLPLSLRLLREVHERLMAGVRGEHKFPGEFRRTQNWIGPIGVSLANAAFVPPPPQEMNQALSNLEIFMHDTTSMPIAVQCAVVHAQFETIHPFLDGNGRIGRLMVSLLLHERQVLVQPLLYISLFLKQNRTEYYDRLMAVREKGDWEGWIKFFLRGVSQVGREAARTAQRVIVFRENLLDGARKLGKNEMELAKLLFSNPILDIRTAQKLLGCSYVTASTTMQSLVKEGCVRELTGNKRNKLYKFHGYTDLFEDQMTAVELDVEGSESAQVERERGG